MAEAIWQLASGAGPQSMPPRCTLPRLSDRSSCTTGCSSSDWTSSVTSSMEINVFSPGGLGSAQKFTGVNFTHAVIQALERKVQYMSFYRRNFDNVEMATL
jgi:hypothetical protein